MRISKEKIRRQIDVSFMSAGTYNEAVSLFFDWVCDMVEIDNSKLPTNPQDFIVNNDDGSIRIIPRTTIVNFCRKGKKQSNE